jgi:hypothetical protein
MHHQIASAIELLQRRAISAGQHTANPPPCPDPLTLFLLFRQQSPSAPGTGGSSEARGMPPATRQLTITQGNIDNSHMYLTGAMDLFPDDVMGGSSSRVHAASLVRVHWGDEIVETDIACDKHMFRRRDWVRRFFEANRIMAGDRVLLERLEPYVYRVAKVVTQDSLTCSGSGGSNSA